MSIKSPYSIVFFSFLPLSASYAHEPLLEQIEVTGRRANLIGEATSASQGQVSGDEISLRPVSRAGDVLEVVPGLVATQHSGNGKANQYFIRGFNLDHGTDFATQVDGMPVNMRSHGHGQGYADVNFIIPETLHSVSYQKGSYYADLGDFSGTGGATLSTANEIEFPSLKLSLGEYGYQRAVLTGSAGVAQNDVLFAAEHQRYDGPWRDTSEDVSKTNVWLKFLGETQAGHYSVTFMGYDNSWNSADQIPARAVEQGLISQYGSIDPTVGGESSRYSLSFDWHTALANGELDTTFYVIDYEMDLWSNFSYFTQGPQGDQFQQVDDRKIYGWDIRYALAGELSGKPVLNSFGSQLRIDDIQEVGLLSTTARELNQPLRLDAVEQSSNSLWWQMEIQWQDNLRTILGLRYDYFDFDVDPLAAAEPGSLALNAGSASDDIVTPSLSVIYNPTESLELYASIGEGFHSNDARGTTIQVSPLDGEPLEAVDPLVSTLGYEFGARAFISDKLNASVAFWSLKIDSELLFVGDEGTTEDTGVSSTRRGMEITTYYTPHMDWTFDLEIAVTDAQLDEAVDGFRDIPGALEQVISAGVMVNINEDLYSQLRVRHFGEYALDGGEKADGSTVVNLRMGYSLSEKLSLSLDVFNLFDSNDRDIEYFYESQLLNESAPVEDRHFHVFEPRSVRASLTWYY